MTIKCIQNSVTGAQPRAWKVVGTTQMFTAVGNTRMGKGKFCMSEEGGINPSPSSLPSSGHETSK